MLNRNVYNPETGEWNDSYTGDYLWTKTNLGEAVAEPMTPLTWSVIQFTFSDLVYLPGFPALGNICGFPYFNFSSLASALHTLGFSQKFALNKIEDLLNIRLPEGVEIPLIPYSRWKFLSILYRFIRLFGHFYQSTKEASNYAATNREWFLRTREKIALEESPAGLLRLWEEDIQGHLKWGFWIVLGTANTSADSTFGLRRKLLPLVGSDDANTLIANLSDGPDLLASLGPVVGLSKVASGAMSREDYLEQFGHRGPNEFELSSPRPVENHEWLDRELSRFQEEPVQIQTLLNRQKETFDAAWVRFGKLYPHKVKPMQRKLTQNAQLARLREQARSEYVRDRWLVRLFALRGGKLTGLENDIFFLTLEEMQSMLSGDDSAARLIPARKEMHQRLQTLPPLPTIIHGAFDPFKWAKDPLRRIDIFDARSAATQSQLSVITGSPGSTGKVESTVRIIEDPKDGGLLQPGEILVAVQTDIAWTLLFPRAAAVVTDVGAPLSHAAIVARELGIPAVVGCGNATMLLKTGDRVRVDGGAGTVSIL